MDGPNVNWSFLSRLKKEEEKTTEMLELGSCGLHVLHGALQTGHKAAHWKINEFLRGLYWLFKDSPARRADFSNITGSKLFPKKFCTTRWVESSSAADRALEIFDNVQQYVQSQNVKLPINISVSSVKAACSDDLFKAKLAFFCTIASHLETFLVKYQSGKPMVPFLYEDLEKIIRNIITRFVKSSLTNLQLIDLLKVDFSKVEHLKPLKEIDLGFSARKHFLSSKGSEKNKLDFLRDCQKFLQALTGKLLERSALKYKLTKSVSSLNPKCIASSKGTAQSRFKSLLQLLHDKQILSSSIAEKAINQFSQFTIDYLDKCREFSETMSRLDEFYRDILQSKQEFFELYEVIKYILILSHGNASVESGFSINKQILVENMQEESVIAQRQIYDAVLAVGGVLNITINQKMRNYVKSSYNKYSQALKNKRQETKAISEAVKEREIAKVKIKQLEQKRKLLSDQTNFECQQLEREIFDLRKRL